MTIEQARIGIAYDLHRTVAGRELRLGGLTIPHERGLLGHSDADIVLHAVTDALLGAVGAGDIGELFPDTDARWKDQPSATFVREALRRVREAGGRVGNVDIVIHAQAPRLGPHKAAISDSLAALLDTAVANVSVKATTNEGLGEIGRGEAMACWAAVLVLPAAGRQP